MKLTGLKRFCSVFLVITMLFMVASCSTRGITTFQEELSSNQLIRTIIGALNDKRQTAESYSNIPSSQKTEVSYSYYSEYLSIIRSISANRGNITAFRILSDEELRAYVGNTADASICENLIAVELVYAEEYDYPICFFLAKNGDKAFLSLDWIKGSISIFSYSDYYFSMLDESNYDGLYTLLRPGLSEIYSDNAVYARANALVDFYQLRVRSVRAQYEIKKLLPHYMEVCIPEVFLNENSSVKQHVVSFVETSEETYSILDEIPFYPDDSMLSLFDGEREIVKIGEHYSNDYIDNVLGGSIHQSSYVLDEPVNDYSNKLLINYIGLVLVFYANVGDDGIWEGYLVSIRVSSNCKYTVGQSIDAGMTRTEVLELLPYVENVDYLINCSGFYISFVFNDDDDLSIIKIAEK